MASPALKSPTPQDFSRLEALALSIKEYPIDNETGRRPRTPLSSPSSPHCQLLLPDFQSPPHIGPNGPPTPAESIQPSVSADDGAPAPVVRVTTEVWDAMNNDLTSMSRKKRALEERLASLERDHQDLRDEDHDAETQIGRLRYQNEVNRDQKAEMGRSLARDGVKIMEQQLEIDNLGNKITDLEAEIHRRGKLIGEAQWLRTTVKDCKAAHARDLEEKAFLVQQLEDTIERLTRERDAATQAQVYAGDHVTRAQNHADTLSRRERFITELRQKLLDEQMRSTDLEEKVERLQEKVDQGNLDSLKEQLREKSSTCDRMRTNLKIAERHLELSQSRLEKVLNHGEALRGGAHLVIPNEKTKLPKNVVSCSECYAKNITCDDGARCRNCVEGLTKCSRWRCSMKQKLGHCPDVPCTLPHDPQGWLVTKDPRPQW